MFHRSCHGIDMTWRATDRLSDHASFSIEQAARKILALAHDGAEGRAYKRVLLLIGHGQKSVPNDFQVTVSIALVSIDKLHHHVEPFIDASAPPGTYDQC